MQNVILTYSMKLLKHISAQLIAAGIFLGIPLSLDAAELAAVWSNSDLSDQEKIEWLEKQISDAIATSTQFWLDLIHQKDEFSAQRQNFKYFLRQYNQQIKRAESVQTSKTNVFAPPNFLHIQLSILSAQTDIEHYLA